MSFGKESSILWIEFHPEVLILWMTKESQQGLDLFQWQHSVAVRCGGWICLPAQATMAWVVPKYLWFGRMAVTETSGPAPSSVHVVRFLKIHWDCRNGSVMESPCCSCRGPCFGFRHLSGQLTTNSNTCQTAETTPATGDPTLSSGLWEHLPSLAQTHLYTHNYN